MFRQPPRRRDDGPIEVCSRIARALLGSQLEAGFAVRGVLAGCHRDPRSRDHATLLEWVRPEPA